MELPFNWDIHHYDARAIPDAEFSKKIAKRATDTKTWQVGASKATLATKRVVMSLVSLSPAPTFSAASRTALYAIPSVFVPPANATADAIEDAFLRGSDQGLAAVYEAHGSLIHTLCARAHPNAAADITQEVFLAAWKARDRFDPSRGPLAAWLVGIAKNKIVDAYRKDGRRVPEIHDADGDRVDRVPDGRTPLDRLADRLLVTEALSTLPERPRKVIELAFLEGLTHEQITEQTAIPLGTVKSDIKRGLARLRSFLEAAS